MNWERVNRCKHPRADLTENHVRCWTEYCEATEEFCPDCRAYIVKCQCGCCNFISGWSERRWRKYWNRK